jgi:hypothetical protein
MSESKHILQQSSPDFEKAEMDQLKAGLKRSYTERFHMMTTLMKMNLTMRKASIQHKTLPSSNK